MCPKDQGYITLRIPIRTDEPDANGNIYTKEAMQSVVENQGNPETLSVFTYASDDGEVLSQMLLQSSDKVKNQIGKVESLEFDEKSSELIMGLRGTIGTNELIPSDKLKTDTNTCENTIHDFNITSVGIMTDVLE